jgi:eukaryotic-like serine/threonine-protein kinase
MATGYSESPAPYCALPAGVRLGEVVAGKYALQRIVGAGGMGVVIGAVHVQLDQRVAIKFMSPLLLSSRDGVERFVREARLAARIQCEHVVRIFDVATLEDGTPYIVMEFLQGEDVGALLRRRGRFPVGDAVDVLLQAGEAMAEAHVDGVVHRDLKPGNLFVCERPDGSPLVKVLDFGISKIVRRMGGGTEQGSLLTGPHVLLGSPLYCSPEQLRASTTVDARSDIWALGAILYELVSGTPPFRGATLLEISTNVMNRNPPPLSASRPEVPCELDDVVARCLAKSPDERFATVADLARALVPFAPGRALLSVERIESVIRKSAQPTDATCAPPVSGVAPIRPPSEETLPSRPDRPASRGGSGREKLPRATPRWVAPVAIAAVAVALAALVASLAADPHGSASRSAPPTLPRPTLATLAASSTPPARTTLDAIPAATPPASTAIAPLPETAPTPVDSTRRTPPGRPAASPTRREPDPWQFGGLR